DNLLQFLAGQADEKWWREVFLLLVGIPEHKLFAPLMQLLLPGVLKEDRADLLRELLTEAEQPDFAFFAEALTNEKTPVESLTAILRLLKGVSDPLVLESARKLREHADENISGLARGILGEEGAAAGKDYDLLLIHRPDDGDAARELARMLLEKGLRSWTNPKRGWEADTWLQHLDDIRVQVQAVVFLMGKNLSFWGDQEEAEDGLDYLATDCRLIAFLPAPGRHAKPRLPASLSEKRVMVLDVPATLAMGANILANAVQGGGRSGQKISVSIEDRIHFIDRATAILEPLPGLRLLPVPGEIFTMGDDHGSYDDEKPAHQVELSPYWLAETPVTNQHFGNFLRATKQREPAYWRDKKFSDPQQPVVGVAWHDAVAFCDWLSKESGNKFFLPSEAQWEYAARGTDGRRYPWGNNDPTKELACYDLSTETGKPALVGQYPAGRGPFGHLDLAGNVWEWCRDVWDKDAYKKRAGAVTKDPFVNGNPADAHPVRGGSWRLPAVGLRAAIRVGYGAGFRFGYLGFRLAAPASTVDS
ncbi:MAG TPA: SUMF1/EgtB/PvdO family nonheme iron enzyme, partial [Magnetococcales bacterium]|nr:SUMF1/EgtB/PvdO family nonheme iron enzyme [Magnetococcales bacterium]